MEKLNNQIAVAKNNRTLVEFLDAMYFEKNAAWPEMGSSRIRIAISDYSNKQAKALYKWDNVKVEDIKEIRSAVESLPKFDSAYTDSAIDKLRHIESIFSKNPGIDLDELEEFEKAIKDLETIKANALKQIVLYEDHKILPYESYANPENDAERLTTGCRITYNPSMKLPIVIEVGQGYATPDRSSTGQIKWRQEHDYTALKKVLSLSDFKKMLDKVCVFADSMIACALQSYYDRSTGDFAERQSRGVASSANDQDSYDYDE